MLTVFEAVDCLNTTTSSRYTYIAEMPTPAAGVALATKLTGEFTVDPSSGEQTTTPGEDGAVHELVVVPVPLSEITCGLPAAESVIVTAPVRVPDWVGVKVTMMPQLAPADSVAGQLLVWAKSPLGAIPLRVNVPPPLLVKVTDCAALVVPICCAPNVRLPGLNVTAGVVEVTTVMVEPALYSAPLSSHT